jgi:hypothetical protein
MLANPMVMLKRGKGILIDEYIIYMMANEMQVGIKRCGILEIRPDGVDSIFDTLAEDDELRIGLKINGEPVPVVNEYKSLGLVLTSGLDVDQMVSKRLTLGRITVNQIFPCQPRDNPGVAAVLRCRIGAIQMAPELVAAGVIRPRYKLVCPYCKQHEKECRKTDRSKVSILGMNVIS